MEPMEHSILCSSALPASHREGGSRCWGEGLAGASESSSSILCLKLTAVTGTLTDIQRSLCPPDFGLQCSLTWSEGRAGALQGQGCQSRSTWSCNRVHERLQRWAKILYSILPIIQQPNEHWFLLITFLETAGDEPQGSQGGTAGGLQLCLLPLFLCCPKLVLVITCDHCRKTHRHCFFLLTKPGLPSFKLPSDSVIVGPPDHPIALW